MTKLKEMQRHTLHLMPMDSIENARFAVNFYTSIGLGAITDDMRDYLERAPRE